MGLFVDVWLWKWDVRVNVNTIGVINSASVDHLMS